MNRIISVNAGGRTFQTYLSTVLRFPDTAFARLFETVVVPQSSPHGTTPSLLPTTVAVPAAAAAEAAEAVTASASSLTTSADAAAKEVFLDVNPDVFARVLDFLRTNQLQLPTHDDALRSTLVHHLQTWELLPYAFPPASPDMDGAGGDLAEADAVVVLPDVCVVQLCDHMQHDQGVKRHAMTITYGADGFQLRRLTQAIRRDLNQQLSSTYWQCYQTNERAAFFTTTKVANGAADLLTTSITQQVIAHTERLGYHLASSYVTLSPDVVHTSVRMLIHNFIFRRTRLPELEEADTKGGLFDLEEGEEGVETFQNFEPRHVGPQRTPWSGAPSRPPQPVAADDLWTK